MTKFTIQLTGNGRDGFQSKLEELSILLSQGSFAEAKRVADELEKDGCPRYRIGNVCWHIFEVIRRRDYGEAISLANMFVDYGF